MFRAWRSLAVLFCLGVCSSYLCASAGYQMAYTRSIYDLTPYATGGSSPINIWKQVAGNGVCNPTTLSPAPDSTLWCVGANGDLYEWTPSSKAWTDLNFMGHPGYKGVAAMGQNVGIYTLQATSQCSAYNTGVYQVFAWNGSAWFAPAPGCVSQLQVGSDGTLIGVTGTDGALFYSSNGGVSWMQLPGTGWTYAAISDVYTACAVNAGKTYWLNPNTATETEFSPQPAFAVSQCATVDQPGDFDLALGTNGQVSVFNETTSAWDTVGVISNMTQLVTAAKSLIFALNSSGAIYHWNIFAPELTLAASGTWDNCPNPGDTCPNTPVHAYDLAVQFPNGLGDYLTNTQGSISPIDELNVSARDVATLCDLGFGPGNDTFCNPVIPQTGGTIICNASGATLAQSPAPPNISWSFLNETQFQNMGEIPDSCITGKKGTQWCDFNVAPSCSAATTPPNYRTSEMLALASQSASAGWLQTAPICISVFPPGSRAGTWVCGDIGGFGLILPPIAIPGKLFKNFPCTYEN